MKFRIILVFLAIASLHPDSFAQEKKGRMASRTRLLSEKVITSISVGENIDLVLIQGNREDVSVKMKENTFHLVDLNLDGETLIISPRRSGQGRVAVFITISDLRHLALHGDAFASTRGKLVAGNLQVTIYDNARLQLGAKGKVLVDTPDNYQVLKEQEYILAHAINKS